MIPLFIGMVSCLGVFFRSRYNLGLEILALRQQLGVFKRRNPRPRLRFHDRMSSVLFRRLGPSSSSVLVIVKKDTPATRAVVPKPTESARLVAYPRLGGRHHRYGRQHAA